MWEEKVHINERLSVMVRMLKKRQEEEGRGGKVGRKFMLLVLWWFESFFPIDDLLKMFQLNLIISQEEAHLVRGSGVAVGSQMLCSEVLK